MKIFLTILVVLAIAAMFLTKLVFAADEPPHSVVQTDGNIEIREYEPMIVAEVQVSGNMRDASNSGFRPLADFIFGNNKPAKQIDMTAPVMREASTTIDMTAPVTRTANGDQSWTVAFVMPAEWTMKTLPKPNNPDVTIRELAAQTIAAIRFSGNAKQDDYDRKFEQLKAWLTTNSFVVVGEPKFAGYDHPLVPGFLRRNEVMVPVTKSL
jgi:DNA gyrase inhibitor GyrI